MWYKKSLKLTEWQEFASSLGELAQKSVETQIQNKHLPNNSDKLAQQLQSLFMQKLSEYQNLRQVKAHNTDAYDNMKEQMTIYSLVTYRSITSNIIKLMSDAIVDDSTETMNRKAQIPSQIALEVKNATLHLYDSVINPQVDPNDEDTRIFKLAG